MFYVLIKNTEIEGRPTSVVLAEHPDKGPCWLEVSITHPYTLRFTESIEAEVESTIYGGTVKEVSNELYAWLVEQTKLDTELCLC
jgi:hypothetical protein